MSRFTSFPTKLEQEWKNVKNKKSIPLVSTYCLRLHGHVLFLYIVTYDEWIKHPFSTGYEEEGRQLR